jgi:hypothetical protein
VIPSEEIPAEVRRVYEGNAYPEAEETTMNRVERETGIEPATSSLGSWRSTAELLPLRDS